MYHADSSVLSPPELTCVPETATPTSTQDLHEAFQQSGVGVEVVLSLCCKVSAGPFTSVHRSDCLTGWVAACEAAGVPCSPKFSLSAALGDPVKIRQWNILGLPKDEFSSENAIAVDQGRR